MERTQVIVIAVVVAVLALFGLRFFSDDPAEPDFAGGGGVGDVASAPRFGDGESGESGGPGRRGSDRMRGDSKGGEGARGGGGEFGRRGGGDGSGGGFGSGASGSARVLSGGGGREGSSVGVSGSGPGERGGGGSASVSDQPGGRVGPRAGLKDSVVETLGQRPPVANENKPAEGENALTVTKPEDIPEQSGEAEDVDEAEEGEGIKITDRGRVEFPNAGNASNTGTISFQIKPEWAGGDQSDNALVQIRQEHQWNNRLELVKNGEFLRFIVTPDTGQEIVRAHAGGYAPLDVTDGAAVERAFLDFAPTVVVHAAALSKVETCEREKARAWAVNVDATATLARLCKRHGARLVLLSTDFLFDGTAGPYAEDDRPAPVNAYGRSKLAAENALRRVGLGRWTSVRTSLVFGTGDRLRRTNVATLLVRELGAGRPFEAAVDQFRTPAYAPDLADGLLRLIRYQKDGVYHVAGRERLSVFAFCRRAAAAFGFDPTLVRPTTTAALHPDGPRPLAGGLLILRAESEVGYRPRSLDEALLDLAPRLGLPIPAE